MWEEGPGEAREKGRRGKRGGVVRGERREERSRRCRRCGMVIEGAWVELGGSAKWREAWDGKIGKVRREREEGVGAGGYGSWDGKSGF